MRFGIFYEHQIPRPWEDGAHERLLLDALDQVELADRVGFDYVWEVEHHFLEEYSHSSAPEVFLAAASQRTSRIRLGHGIVQLPPAFNHPARIVERAATLDLISGGRVELGTGEASSQAELGGFGVAREEKRAQWEEALDAVARMFVEEPFAGADGRFVRMPPRNVMPKAKQRPHPPLWVACSRRDTILMAARKGLGALSFSFVEPEAAKEWVDEYYALIASEECVPAGFAVNPNFAVVLPMMCHPDEAVAIERGIDGAHFFGYSLAHYYVFGEHRPGATDDLGGVPGEPRRARVRTLDRHARPGAAGREAAPGGARLAARRGRHARPDRRPGAALRGRRRRPGDLRDAGREEPARAHLRVDRAVRRSEVLPRFAAEADAREEAKRERLADACSRALKRREPARAVEPGYVIEPQDEPRPTYSTDSADGASLGERAAAVESAFASFVRGRSDEQLDRLMGSGPGLRAVQGDGERVRAGEGGRLLRGDPVRPERVGRAARMDSLDRCPERALAEPRVATAPAVIRCAPRSRCSCGSLPGSSTRRRDARREARDRGRLRGGRAARRDVRRRAPVLSFEVSSSG